MVSGEMAVSRNFLGSAIVTYLYLFCCLSRSLIYLNTLIFCPSYALDDSGVTKSYTSRYTSPLAYFSTNLETKRQESLSVHTTLIFYTQHFASKKFVISK